MLRVRFYWLVGRALLRVAETPRELDSGVPSCYQLQGTESCISRSLVAHYATTLIAATASAVEWK
jgi:hypothetical protein